MSDMGGTCVVEGRLGTDGGMLDPSPMPSRASETLRSITNRTAPTLNRLLIRRRPYATYAPAGHPELVLEESCFFLTVT